ncbi:MAG: tetratricopeptide repeat-containing sensor histidine kinase [Marinifilaceae bacterium]|jgi:signal transduction histidine kinase|nr:tetratricopeptide repeat-containing sensor histidine kinase [Marinifilaceae bacterium]
MRITLNLFLIFVISFAGYSQKPTDTLKKLLSPKLSDSTKFEEFISLSEQYRKRNVDTAFQYSNMALEHARKMANIDFLIRAKVELSSCYQAKGIMDSTERILMEAKKMALDNHDAVNAGKIYNRLASLYREVGQYDSSLYYFNESLKICNKVGDMKTKISCLNGFGIVYWKRGELDKALNKYLEAYDIAEKQSDYVSKMRILLNMGNIYSAQNNLEKAIHYYNDVLNMGKDNNTEIYKGVVLNNLANVYQMQEDYKKAHKYFEESLALAKKMGNQHDIALVLNNIGENYIDMGELENAIVYLDQSLRIHKKLKSNPLIVTNLKNLANVYYKAGDPKKEIQALNSALELAEKIKLKSKYRDLLKAMSQHHERNGDYKEALEWLTKHNVLDDSLTDIQKSDKMAHLQAKFHSEQKERENLQLREKNKDVQENLAHEKSIKTYLIIFTILVLGLLVAIYMLLRSKVNVNNQIRDVNEKLEESNNQLKVTSATKDKFFSIIAHDLRSPFNAIMGFSELIRTEISMGGELEIIKEYNDSVNESAQRLFTLLENLLEWANSQRGELEFNPIQLDVYELVLNNMNIFQHRAMDKQITLETDVEPETIVTADYNMVNTVIRNLVSNALKFTHEKGKIVISATKKDDFIYMAIKDNGVGISKENQEKLFNLSTSFSTNGTNEESGTGLGLLLCKEFVERNGGEIWVDSEPDEGSKFQFTLKIA